MRLGSAQVRRTNRTGPTTRQPISAAPPDVHSWNNSRQIWYGEGDLNPHGIAPASTSRENGQLPRASWIDSSLILRHCCIAQFRPFSVGGYTLGYTPKLSWCAAETPPSSATASAPSASLQGEAFRCVRRKRDQGHLSNSQVQTARGKQGGRRRPHITGTKREKRTGCRR